MLLPRMDVARGMRLMGVFLVGEGGATEESASPPRSSILKSLDERIVEGEASMTGSVGALSDLYSLAR